MRKIDRFLQYLDYKGITENKATVDCELSKGLIGQAKSGKSDLGNKAIEKVLSFYQDLSRVWLLTGEGSMLINAENQPENRVEEKPEEKDSVERMLLLVESQSKVIESLTQLIKAKDEKIEELLEELDARKGGNATDVAPSSSASAV